MNLWTSFRFFCKAKAKAKANKKTKKKAQVTKSFARTKGDFTKVTMSYEMDPWRRDMAAKWFDIFCMVCLYCNGTSSMGLVIRGAQIWGAKMWGVGLEVRSLLYTSNFCLILGAHVDGAMTWVYLHRFSYFKTTQSTCIRTLL